MNVAVNIAAAGSFPVLTVFTVFVSSALFLAIWVTSDRVSASDFYVSDGKLTPAQNGIALFGDYISAATLLGSPGLVALTGYDGIFPLLMGPLVTWIIMLLLVAEPFNSTGKFTVGDSLARRLKPRPIYAATGVATMVICTVYLIAQLVGAGTLAAPVLGFTGEGAQKGVVAGLGLLMILYVVIGGMRASTLVQWVKAVLLLGGSLVVSVMVMSKINWSPFNLLEMASEESGYGDRFLQPGLNYGDDQASKADLLSQQMAMLLGAAGLPHLLLRLGAVPHARAARGSSQWATYLVLTFVLIAGVMGFGAAALVGTGAIAAESPTGNAAVLMLAEYVGGAFLLTLVVCVVFTTVLAVVSGIILAAATSLAHDFYQMVGKDGKATERQEFFVARAAVLVVGVGATALSMYAQNLNISFLVGLAFAMGASSILPVILYNMYWKGLTTRGALWSIYGGVISAVVLVVLSPAISGDPSALLPDADFAYFPLRNPGIVSIPLGFLLGWLGSVTDKKERGEAEFAELEVRILSGTRS